MTVLASELRHTARLRHEVAQREKALYGTLLDDVDFLRRRGFAVHAELKGSRRCYRVGNRLLDASELRAVAARERRLLGPVMPVSRSLST